MYTVVISIRLSIISNALESQLQAKSVYTMSDNMVREAGRFDL